MFTIVVAIMIAQSPLQVASTTQIIKTDVSNLKEPIPIFADDYIDFIKCATYFIDNSMLIEQFLINGTLTGTHVITMPKSFGKTLNTFMLKEFLSIKVDRETGERIPLKKTATYNLFNNRRLFTERATINLDTDFLIKKKTDAMTLLGTYPVIYISLHACSLTFESLKDVENLVKLRVLNSLREHRYLRKSPDLQTEFDTYNNLAPGSNVHDITAVIAALESMLFHFFHKKAFIIVDDYDGVMNQIFTQKYKLTENEKLQVVEFFASFYSGILSVNVNIQGALLTGILPWKELASISSISSLKYYESFTSDIVEYYGMKPAHVTMLLQKLSLTHHNESVFKNYYGYHFGENGTNIKLNPASIANFLREKKVLNFRSESAEVLPLLNTLIKIEYSHRALLLLLLRANQKVVIRNRNLLTGNEFHTISKYIIEKANINDEHSQMTNIILKFLFAQGYFTQEPGSLNRASDQDSFTIHIKIPNDEIFSILWRNYENFIMGSKYWKDDNRTFYKLLEKYKIALCTFLRTAVESKDIEYAANSLSDYIYFNQKGDDWTRKFFEVLHHVSISQNLCGNHFTRCAYTFGHQWLDLNAAVNNFMPGIKSDFENSKLKNVSQIKVCVFHFHNDISVRTAIITREEGEMKVQHHVGNTKHWYLGKI